MSYRKIEVNGTQYEYVVGRSHVKVRGPGMSKVLAKSDIGQLIGDDRFVVTPANIRNVVLGRNGPRTLICEEHGVRTSALAYDPFSREIHGKGRLMINCAQCLEMRRCEI